MKPLLLLLCLCLALGSLAPAVSADPNSWSSISLHVVAPPVATPCDALPSLTNATVNTTLPTSPLAPGVISPSGGPIGETATVYYLVCNGSDSVGVAGMEFGIQYTDMTVTGEALCADLQFPSDGWPSSGGGQFVVWGAAVNCQNTPAEPFVPRTVIAIGGALYVYTYAAPSLVITPRPASGAAKVADCSGKATDITGLSPSHLGIADAGSGYNPCGAPTPVEVKTWGRVKAAYAR